MIGYTKLPKLEVDKEILNNAVAAQQKKKFTRVTVPAKKRGTKTEVPTVSFKMYKEIPALALTHFSQLITSAGVALDNDGVATLDPMQFESALHLYIIENLTSLPVPMTEGSNGESIIDVDTVLAYGDFFTKESTVYAGISNKLRELGEKACEQRINAVNRLVGNVVNASLNTRDIINDPAIQNLIKEHIGKTRDVEP